jgi:hypothetical protein
MKRLALALLLPAGLLLVGTAASAYDRTTPPGALSKLLYRVYGSIVIPAEWAGIWTVTDSTYDCNRVFQEATTQTDTLCAGMLVYDPPPDGDFTINCTGTADGNEVHATCTGSGTFDPCTVDFFFQTDGTRTSDSYSAESRTEMTIGGPSNPCDFVPDQCFINRSHGTRIAPEPAEYCATPAEIATWGKVKSVYR